MRAALSGIFLLLFILPAWAQGEQPGQAADPTRLLDDARALYVARTIELRQDQVAKVIPLLQQAQERLKARDAALDELWARTQTSFVAMNQALLAGRQPTQGTVNGVKRATDAYNETRTRADADLEGIADQILALLDPQQAAKVESLREVQARRQGLQKLAGVADIPAYIERYVVAMRQLLPEEYDALRVTMALRLATRLAAVDSPGYNNAVANVLRIMDTVRRLTDAQFAQNQPQLRRSIARALQLPPEVPAQAHPVSFDDLMVFVTHDRTALLLQEFKAAPAMEVTP